MTTSSVLTSSQEHVSDLSIQSKTEGIVNDLIASLPDPQQLTSAQRRGIIARYTAVLEGNFIYWMTATLIATKSEDAKVIILENLHEEVRDSHPEMMREFAMCAQALPTDRDALAVHEDLKKVRLFLGRLAGVQSVLTMAFFEGFIQQFMPFLAGLASAEGSREMVYTDVHGVCDIAHTEGLYRALSTELAAEPVAFGTDLFEGVYLLRDLIQKIVFYRPESASA